MPQSVDRREFIEAAIGGALAVGLTNTLASAIEALPADVGPLIDPLLLADPLVVPAAENAYPLLEAAAKAVVGSASDVLGESDDSCWPNEPQARATVIDWLDKNREALDLFDEALTRDRAAFPDIPWGDDQFDFIVPTRSLIRLSRQRALRLEAAGDSGEAIVVGRSILKATRLLKSSGGVMVDYLMGTACEGLAQSLICKLVRHRRVSETMLRPLLNAPADQADDWRTDLRHVTQAEFFRFLLPKLEKTKGADLPAVIRSFAGDWCDGMEFMISREDFEGRLRQIEQLFEGHPRAFDRADTIRRASQLFADVIRGFDAPNQSGLAAREPLYSDELAAWPESLNLFELSFAKEVKAGEADVALARRMLRSVDNPIGKQFVRNLTVLPEMRDVAARSQLRRQAARLVVAACIFRSQTGRLPANLEQLVAAKLVERVALDPLVDHSLVYSCQDEKLWLRSASEDELKNPDYEGGSYWPLALRDG